MPALSCTRCSETHSTPKAFLLTCAACRRAWHHRKLKWILQKYHIKHLIGEETGCHIPPVSDGELIQLIKAYNEGDVVGGLSGWTCRRCLKRRQASEGAACANPLLQANQRVSIDAILNPNKGEPLELTPMEVDPPPLGGITYNPPLPSTNPAIHSQDSGSPSLMGAVTGSPTPDPLLFSTGKLSPVSVATVLPSKVVHGKLASVSSQLAAKSTKKASQPISQTSLMPMQLAPPQVAQANSPNVPSLAPLVHDCLLPAWIALRYTSVHDDIWQRSTRRRDGILKQGRTSLVKRKPRANKFGISPHPSMSGDFMI